jgi:signal transduction histidine kinase
MPMNKWLEKIAQRIGSKKAILVLTAIILFHIFFIIHILRDNRVDRQVAERSALIQKIINVIHMTRATPINNRQVAIKAIDDPDIQVTLTKVPQSRLRYKASSLWPIIYELENNHRAYFISIELNNGEWLNIKASLYSREVLTHLLFIVVELIVFASILIAFFSINRFTAPLKKIKLSAEHLGIDLDTKPFDVYGPQVVRETSTALNQMQNRIMQLVRNRTQLLASISHDLRTPIARAQLRAQFIEDSTYKTQLLNDLNEMEHMISETLSFAREDSKREAMKKIDLVSILQSICNDASDMGSNVTFHTDMHRIAYDGRPISLKRAFTNIINNAIRYAGNAVVKIEINTKAIVISVEDDGPGLPEAELEKVLEPFYRSEQSRSRDTGGVGLGLAITHDIISAHHGKIKLQNKEPKGLCVIVKLVRI